MGCGVVVFFSLLYFIEAQELQHVFVQRGKNLYLEVKEPGALDTAAIFFWKFNTSNNIVNVIHNGEPTLFGSYKGRAELSQQNYSLLLKNVQHNDSGDYTAVVIGDQDQRVAEYKVTVQDPVSPVKLTVTPSSCNITVTCSTVDLNISHTFTCEDQICSRVEEKNLNATKTFFSLTVNLQQGTIFCNHSNKVSWEQSKKVNISSCETKTALNTATVAGISTSVIVVLAAVIVFFSLRKCKRGNTENTIYDVPQDILPDQNQLQTVSGDASCQSPTSTYALVEFHTGPKTTKTHNTPQPDSVYAQVNRAKP